MISQWILDEISLRPNPRAVLINRQTETALNHEQVKLIQYDKTNPRNIGFVGLPVYICENLHTDYVII